MEKPASFVPVVPRGENPFRAALEALKLAAELEGFMQQGFVRTSHPRPGVRPCGAFLITELPGRREFARGPRRQFVVQGTHDALVAIERCNFALDEVPDGYEVSRCEARSFDPGGMLVTFHFKPTQGLAWA